MSRKKKASTVDTGGLDLQKFASEPRAHVAMEELESLPPAQTLAGSSAGPEQSVDNRQVAGSNPAPPTIPEELEFGPIADTPNKGIFLHVALVQSFFHMAARRGTTNGNAVDFYVVSNGQRFWTASPSLEPMLVTGAMIGPYGAEAERDDWYPIKGSEKGLCVDENYR